MGKLRHETDDDLIERVLIDAQNLRAIRLPIISISYYST